MAFHEVRFPDNISRGARGGPERRTQIVELASGDEERNASWANSRRRYDVAYGIRRADDLAAVVAFFEARNGRLHGFRCKDWADYKSGLPSGRRSPRPTSRSAPGRQPTTVPAGETLHHRRAVLDADDHQARRRNCARGAGRGGADLRLDGRHHDRRRHLHHRPCRRRLDHAPASNSTCRCASTPTRSTSPSISSGSARSPPSPCWRVRR